MIVVVRDVNNLINDDFAASNDAVEIYFDADNNNVVDVNAVDRAGGKCGIDTADNNLTYFNVSNRLFGWFVIYGLIHINLSLLSRVVLLINKHCL